MTKEKLILDIRYYPELVENSKGKYKPIIDISYNANSIGVRIARKLRELNFISGSFDHIYINFTTSISESLIESTSKMSGNRIKSFNVGVDIEKLSALSETKFLNYFEEITFKVLNLIAKKEQTSLLDEVKNELDIKKSEIEILHKEKETKTYKVTIKYQIRPNGSSSIATVYYLDKRNNSKFSSQINLGHYEDIFFLASSISVTKGNIILKPRASFKAEIYNRNYNVPISISIT